MTDRPDVSCVIPYDINSNFHRQQPHRKRDPPYRHRQKELVIFRLRRQRLESGPHLHPGRELQTLGDRLPRLPQRRPRTAPRHDQPPGPPAPPRELAQRKAGSNPPRIVIVGATAPTTPTTHRARGTPFDAYVFENSREEVSGTFPLSYWQGHCPDCEKIIAVLPPKREDHL